VIACGSSRVSSILLLCIQPVKRLQAIESQRP
jgi:hypothetical protein